AASRPEAGDRAFGQRLWQRAQGLISIREGDRVIVGNPAAGVLDEAQTRLDAGDLAGAVAAVSKLTGPPAQALADWLAQANALLAARAALATMAAQA
ncbi:MAG TPA: mitofilin family membrane protein, partial [Acetobacteraceae bacterium]|nr:mitofilin family membrane protein [Acetobacteraceae bacterium]